MTLNLKTTNSLAAKILFWTELGIPLNQNRLLQIGYNLREIPILTL
jgi:hypothetical protein